MTCTREELLVDISEWLEGMRKQEVLHYSVPDYLAAEWHHGLRDATTAEPDDKGDAAAAVISKGWTEGVALSALSSNG